MVSFKGRIRSFNSFIGISTLMVFMAILLFLSFFHLSNSSFYQDEAEVAILARNMVKIPSLIPVAWDGNYLLSLNKGDDFNDNFVWKWHPWFPIYLTAGSFKLFGIGIFQARFPHVLFGFLFVIGQYLFVKKLFGTRAALLSTLIFILSPVFYLHIRTAKYYACTMLTGLGLIYSFFVPSIEKKVGKIVFVTSAIFLFYSNYVPFAFMLSTFLLYVVFFKKQDLKTILWLFFLIAIFTVPFLLTFGLPQTQLMSMNLLDISRSMLKLAKTTYLFIPCILALVLVVFEQKSEIKNIAKFYILAVAIALPAVAVSIFHFNYFIYLYILSSFIISLFVIRFGTKQILLFFFSILILAVVFLSNGYILYTNYFEGKLYREWFDNPANDPIFKISHYIPVGGSNSVYFPNHPWSVSFAFLRPDLRFINDVSFRSKNEYKKESLPSYIFDKEEIPDFIIMWDKSNYSSEFIYLGYRYISIRHFVYTPKFAFWEKNNRTSSQIGIYRKLGDDI